MRWPKLHQVDPGREFMGSFSQLLAKHSVQVRRGRDQGIVERFNRTLAERLFGHQYAQEMRLPSGERSTEWVKRLPSVVAALNGEVTRLTHKKPSDAIKAKTLTQKSSSVVPERPLSLKEQKVPSGVGLRYLYQPGALEGGRRRATDPVWSLEVYRLGRPTSPYYTTCRVTMPHNEALFEKSCLWCHQTHSYHRMGSSGVGQLFNPPRDFPRGPHPCVHMPACPPHFLRSSAWSQRVRERPCSDVARRCDDALTAGHPCQTEGLLFEEGLFVLLVPDVLLHDILFYTLRLLGVFFPASLKD